MSQSHLHHPPNAPDGLPDDDPDSDVDLDLQELDPLRSSPPSTSPLNRSPANNAGKFRGLGARIPLRNLRAGRARGDDRRGGDPDAEDLRGLLQDEDDTKRSSDGSLGLLGDEVSLLSGRHARKPETTERRGLLESVLRPWRSRLWFSDMPSPLYGSSREHQDDEAPEHDPSSNRTVAVGLRQPTKFPANVVSNAKYNPWNFLPLTLYHEFSFFYNMYFLLVALSQIIPALRIGYLSSYIVPLALVVSITLGKEALDDIARRRRDAEANSEGYTVLNIGKQSNINSNSTGHRAGKRAKRAKFVDERVRGQLSTTTKSETSVQEVLKPSRELRVGDVLKIRKNQRIPADVIILRVGTSETAVTDSESAFDEVPNGHVPLISGESVAPTLAGEEASKAGIDMRDPQVTATPADGMAASEAFIRTDQLDGETDWKLRLSSPLTQSLELNEYGRLRITAGKPDRRVHEFAGTIELLSERDGKAAAQDAESQEDGLYTQEAAATAASTGQPVTAPLTIDNTAWANTVLASNGWVLAVVLYTGSETRQALSTSPSRSKTGLLEHEINALTKILCFITLALSFLLVGLERVENVKGREWYVAVMRFLILFSTIVPISMRVNLDMGKSVYARFIEKDTSIPGTIVRTSTIPEDLGRIEYLLSDKTGTLTQNDMELKKVHIGTVSYANEAMDEVAAYISQWLSQAGSAGLIGESTLFTPSSAYVAPSASATRMRREIGSRVRDVVLALALCHNVTPTTEEKGDGTTSTAYQASSPDEIAIVRWAESIGLRLSHRDRKSIALESTETGRLIVRADILNLFPFTSEGKRMGIVVKFRNKSVLQSAGEADNDEIWFFQKGADTVMSSIVATNDWLEEETANMAREGLRTLVVGRKKLSPHQHALFSERYGQASLALQGRDALMAAVVGDVLERDLELLGVTGVEDKLQRDVKPSLELLRNAGVKIWMLTGDKLETARCVAVSSKLVARGQHVHTIAKLKRKDLAQESLDFLRNKTDTCLLIDGESLSLMLTHFRDAFISVAVRLPTVVACRCSPTQKAEVAKLIRHQTKKRVCCIGDGGNDVSMIQAADVGVGIVGKEGRQASLAADFSIEQFCYLTKLLVWHGRNSYKRSAKLAQFVIHRGLIISVCQTMFSIASKFEPIALYKDWLMVGYATVYTAAPVFSLVLDRDVDESLANLYPELYKELTSGRSLSYRTFFIWVAVSIYQGSMIQGLSQLLVGLDNFDKMVAVSYTVLILNELMMAAIEVTTWHPIMIFSILGTAVLYFGSIPFLGRYFELGYMISLAFVWRVCAILAISLVPPYAGKILSRTLRPPSYRKVQNI